MQRQCARPSSDVPEALGTRPFLDIRFKRLGLAASAGGTISVEAGRGAIASTAP